MIECSVCGDGGRCVFMNGPRKWAMESELVRSQCEEMKMAGYGDLYDSDMHDDREILTDEQFKEACDNLVMETMDKPVKEQDEKGLDQHAPGAKMDLGKVDIFRHFLAMFPRATECTAWVAEYGERKYTYMGWAQVGDGIRRYTAAMNRHILDEAKGEKYDIDPDKGSELAHAAQVAWNAMARLELMIREGEVEIRRGREIEK